MSPTECLVAAPDPLLYATPLPLRRTFYPMSFPAAIATNCEAVIAAAESVWGRFKMTRNERPLELRLAVSDSSATEKPPVRLPRAQGHLVSFLHDAENFIVCDLRAGFGFGWITPVVANDMSYLRYHFVEGCIYLLLESLHLTTAHAACIELNGKGVLLSGECGAGKTTLAYACAKRGWNFACDDAAHLIRKGVGRQIVTNPYQIRFRPNALSIFPELAGNVPFNRPNGKPSIEVDTASLNLATTEQTHADYLVFLNRTSQEPQQLTLYEKDAAFARLAQVICYGDESLREEMRVALRRLLTMDVYEMRYHDLDWAEQRLRALAEHGK